MARGIAGVVLVVGLGIGSIGSTCGPAAEAPSAGTVQQTARSQNTQGHRVVVGNGSDPARRVLAVLDPPDSAVDAPGERVGGLEIRSLSSGARRRLTVPASASIRDARFTADSRQLALDVSGPGGLKLWLVDLENPGPPLVVSASLGEAWPPYCDWHHDGSEVLCRVEPEQGQQDGGRRAGADYLPDGAAATPGEEGVQLAFVNRTTGQVRRVGPAGVYEMADLAPGGQFIVVGRMEQPAGPSVSSSGSDRQRISEIWNRFGKARRRFVGRERRDGGLRPAPTWDPSRPARLVWVDARPSGGDRVCSLEAPFTSDPSLVFEADGRVDRLAWAGDGMLFVREATDRRLVTWAIASGGGIEPKKVWEKKEGES